MWAVMKSPLLIGTSVRYPADVHSLYQHAGSANFDTA